MAPHFFVRNFSRWTEWLLTFSLVVLLLSLVLIAKIQSSLMNPPEIVVRMVEVEVDGAVAKPGLYSIEEGTPFQELFHRVKPHFFADLRGYDLGQPIEADLMLHIEELKELKIEIDGIGSYSVPIGTRVCDLRKIIPALAGIDKKKFKSQRRLKEGERILLDRNLE